MRKRLLPLVLAGVLTLGAACGGDDDAPAATGETTTSTSSTVAEDSSSTSSSTTTSAPGSTTTTSVFNGSTTPTSAPPPADLTETALLTDVRVGTEVPVTRVVFEFEGQIPGFDIQYVDPPILSDGSGEPVAVAGEAFLQVRMEPASGVDLSSGDTFEETYTGPERLDGSGRVMEVVRTGDFEANLTWVIGLAGDTPFRVRTLDAPGRIVIELEANAG